MEKIENLLRKPISLFILFVHFVSIIIWNIHCNWVRRIEKQICYPSTAFGLLGTSIICTVDGVVVGELCKFWLVTIAPGAVVAALPPAATAATVDGVTVALVYPYRMPQNNVIRISINDLPYVLGILNKATKNTMTIRMLNVMPSIIRILEPDVCFESSKNKPNCTIQMIPFSITYPMVKYVVADGIGVVSKMIISPIIYVMPNTNTKQWYSMMPSFGPYKCSLTLYLYISKNA